MRGFNEALAGLPPAEAGGSTVLLRVCLVLDPLRTPERGLDGFRSMGAGAHGFRLGRDLEPKLGSHALLSFQRPGTSGQAVSPPAKGGLNIAPGHRAANGVRPRGGSA